MRSFKPKKFKKIKSTSAWMRLKASASMLRAISCSGFARKCINLVFSPLHRLQLFLLPASRYLLFRVYVCVQFVFFITWSSFSIVYLSSLSLSICLLFLYLIHLFFCSLGYVRPFDWTLVQFLMSQLFAFLYFLFLTFSNSIFLSISG